VETTETNINQLLIAGITPYFLDKGFLWYKDNLQNLLDSRLTQNFFEDNIIYLQKDHSIQF